ncbi:large ribosomal subunit protein bL17m-like [Ornithodoros turicata]|uniref:large ribosomal subunit protein bL17m-like n=1 Tax=Ornithodoros turicata TaxID=34597 RepID=UPI0031390EC8
MEAASRLVPQLRYRVSHRHRNLTCSEGPLGRIEKIRRTLTALLKHERIELNYHRADECRGYAERLITEAIRNGDTHVRTMQLADFWINEKQLIHKLFKVLVPRYANYDGSYTAVHILQTPFHTNYNTNVPGPDYRQNWVALELKGNPYPPVPGRLQPNPFFIPNVLLSEAKREMHKMEFPAKKLA